MPKTKLTLQTSGNNHVVVKNVGQCPAVGVVVSQPGHLDTFSASDNYTWLDPGESQTLTVNETKGLSVGAWNAE